MDMQQKRSEIVKLLSVQNGLFNPSKCPDKDIDFQYIFNESDGDCAFYLSIRDKKSCLKEGFASDPVCQITTNMETLSGISGGYKKPLSAIKEGHFKIKCKSFFAMRNFRKIYSGSTYWELPANLYKGTCRIQKIRKVAVLNCSPRGEKGATAAVTEKFVAGMKKAGAEVEILYPAKMKINPCIGCFQCWVNSSSHCIYHDKDDMKIILEKYWSYDLFVWATPIYHYFGTSAMKTVMDRLFINADPHFIEVDGQYRHPRKVEHIPYYAVLAVGGFPAMNIFEPLKNNFTVLSSHTGIKVIGELYRHTCMLFTVDGLKMKKKDDILVAMEKAGYELIEYQKITKKTKKIAEQKMIDIPVVASMVNMNMDQLQKEKKIMFERNVRSNPV